MKALTDTLETGILPAIKSGPMGDPVACAEAMVEGGAKVVEITLTTPRCLEAVSSIKERFHGRISVAVGTVLDESSARDAIEAGASVIVTPAFAPGVIATAKRFGVACFSGAMTPTEALQAQESGADMIKIFPAELCGPRYMTHLKRVYPNIRLVPSGGVSESNAADFVSHGADAISGARTFLGEGPPYDYAYIRERVRLFRELVSEVREGATHSVQ